MSASPKTTSDAAYSAGLNAFPAPALVARAFVQTIPHMQELDRASSSIFISCSLCFVGLRRGFCRC